MPDQALKPPASRRAVSPMSAPAPAARAPVVPTPVVRGLTGLALAALLLAGCGGNDLSRTFGFTRDAPDEFTVTTQVPLSMPPDFTVRPPQPGVPRPQQTSEQQQAEQALVPETALNGTPTGETSPGQAALVQAAGPTPPQNIRYQVNTAAASEAQQNEGFVDKLMFWREPPPPGVVVDPQKEAQRIRENAALGRSQDTGNTPIIQPAKKGWLQGLF